MAKKTAYALRLEKEIKQCRQAMDRIEVEKRYLMIALNITQHEVSIESLIRQCSMEVYQHEQTKESLKRAKDGNDILAGELGKYRSENMRLSLENMSLRLDQGKFYNKQSLTSIPKEMMRRLIQLVHPDKHNNSEAANAATQWLLSQR